MYDRSAALAVKTVSDYRSALACNEALDNFLKKYLNLSSRLFRAKLQKEPRTTIQALSRELRRRLLPRSEHWKAEAHKRARLVGKARASKAPKANTVALDDQASAVSKRSSSAQDGSKPAVCQILRSAMERQGLNVPKLVVKIRETLRRKRQTKPKVDRSTVYRMVAGKTKWPDPVIRSGLIEALQLEGEDASTVRRALTRNEEPKKPGDSKTLKPVKS
jgi:hypothetical protein